MLTNLFFFFFFFGGVVTYRRERTVREVYEDRFMSDRPGRVCFYLIITPSISTLLSGLTS